MSILKTTLMHELPLNNSYYSMLISMFMISYTFMYFFVGGIAYRFSSRCMLARANSNDVHYDTAHRLITLTYRLMTGQVLLGLAESGIVPALTLAVFT
ncbi:MAG: hypothetical protein ACSLEM_03660 [Candidatus Malihini olakiniferum]